MEDIRLVFLLGAIPKGQNGVGDYVRVLAGEVAPFNIHCSAIALFDDVKTTTIEIDDNLTIHRINRKESTSYKKKYLLDYIKKENPTHLSLQYVPYAFHSKGIPYLLLPLLFAIKDVNIIRHLMVHELAVGLHKKSSIKDSLLKYTQFLLLRLCIRIGNFDSIHTQSTLYQYYLTKWYKKVLYLPLYGNINFNCNTLPSLQDSIIKVALFGGIHTVTDLNDKIKKLVYNIQRLGNKDIKFYFIGRNGAKVKEWEIVLNQLSIPYTIKGEMDGNQISSLFQEMTFGITTTPYPLVEKSGTVMALLEHGLNVLCIRDEWKADVELDYPIKHVYRLSENTDYSSLLTRHSIDVNRKLKTVAQFAREIQFH